MENTRITLVHIQVAKFASEETMCFNAQVLLDGKKIGRASNDGHGGATFVHADPTQHAAMVAAEDYAAQVVAAEPGYDAPISRVVDTLLESWLVRKDVTTRYRRAIKSKVIFLNNGALFNVGPHAGASLERLIEHVRTKHPEAVILNTLPESQAIDRYVAVVMNENSTESLIAKSREPSLVRKQAD